MCYHNVILLTFLLAVVASMTPFPDEVKDVLLEEGYTAEKRSSQKLNVVIFLTNPLPQYHCKANNDDGSLVNFPVKGTLAACKIPKSVSYILKENRKNDCNCEKQLRCSLVSLIQWAQNDRRMATGVISTTKSRLYDELTTIMGPKSCEIESTTVNELKNYRYDTSYRKLNNEQHDFPNIHKRLKRNLEEDSFTNMDITTNQQPLSDNEFVENLFRLLSDTNGNYHNPVKLRQVAQNNRWKELDNARPFVERETTIQSWEPEEIDKILYDDNSDNRKAQTNKDPEFEQVVEIGNRINQPEVLTNPEYQGTFPPPIQQTQNQYVPQYLPVLKYQELPEQDFQQAQRPSKYFRKFSIDKTDQPGSFKIVYPEKSKSWELDSGSRVITTTDLEPGMEMDLEHPNHQDSTEDYNNDPAKNIPVYSLNDVFELMTLLKNMLLSPFVDTNGNKPSADSMQEEPHIDSKRLGVMSEPSMVEMVRKTLRDLKKDKTYGGNNGFLMIVIGGNFSDINCCSSELLKSVKYVRDHTCSKDTLLIVTTICNHRKSPKPPRVENMVATGQNAVALLGAETVYELPDFVKMATEQVHKIRKRDTSSSLNYSFDLPNTHMPEELKSDTRRKLKLIIKILGLEKSSASCASCINFSYMLLLFNIILYNF